MARQLPFTMDRLTQRREQFAHLIARKAGVTDQRIAIAFARIAREDFLGPGPWCISESGDMSPSSNPEYVYQDIVIALAAPLGITNGLPSLRRRLRLDCLHWPISADQSVSTI